MSFRKDCLRLDAAAETSRLVSALQLAVRQRLRKSGGVVGVSGGVDSAVVLALAVRALGPDRVIALILPERESDPRSEVMAAEVARQYGASVIREEITAALEGCGCYQRRDEAIQRVIPEYDAAAGHKVKIVLPPGLLDKGSLNVFSVTVIRPDGSQVTRPLPPREYLQIVAASNFKQRTRMAFLYYHAELRNYAVLGTANKNEHDLGFFVRHGDAGVDVQVIAHLYKTQVYQLAEHLGVPEAIRRRTPTTDTYSAPCSQEEFFFRLPFEIMDLLWFAHEHGFDPREVAAVLKLAPDQVQNAFADFQRKRFTTEPARQPPLGLAPHEVESWASRK